MIPTSTGRNAKCTVEDASSRPSTHIAMGGDVSTTPNHRSPRPRRMYMRGWRSLDADADGARQLSATGHQPQNLSLRNTDRGRCRVHRCAFGVARCATRALGPGMVETTSTLPRQATGWQRCTRCLVVGCRGAHGSAPRQLRSRLQKAAPAQPVYSAHTRIAASSRCSQFAASQGGSRMPLMGRGRPQPEVAKCHLR